MRREPEEDLAIFLTPLFIFFFLLLLLLLPFEK